ncbi:hypothetical protein Tsubulata_050634 [Turnera subulata]|uniref:F-box domain-containing protein n=1 Tax=Turnera subulata TaxID=218843 RepID=A0A9Q0G6F9_9ROSI|nr:hypothetical protein Tsubulata_050634 [Turnera subulata]
MGGALSKLSNISRSRSQENKDNSNTQIGLLDKENKGNCNTRIGSLDEENKGSEDGATCINDLPLGILEKITAHLDIGDRVRSSGVCKYWKSIAMGKHIKSVNPQLPWLVLPSSNSSCDQITMFDIFQSKIQNFDLPGPLRGGWCYGSSKGWLVIAKESVDDHNGTSVEEELHDKIKHQIFLFNPISRVHIELPPISTIPCFNKSLEVPPHPSRSGQSSDKETVPTFFALMFCSLLTAVF